MTEREWTHEREDIGCLKAIEMFHAYFDGEIGDPDDVSDFEAHMEHCRSCMSRAEFEQLVTRKLKESGGERAPEGLRKRLRILMDNF